MDQVSDIKTFVKALGGAKKVAALAGVQPGAVYMAMWRGVIPHRMRLPMFVEAKAKKIIFDPTLLGLEDA
jgi:hypothetical protein